MKRRAAVGLVVALLVALSGCVQLPHPITQSAPKTEPSWTSAQAQVLRDQILASYAKAVAQKDSAAAVDHLTDADRATALGLFHVAKLTRSKPDSDSWRAGKIVSLWSTPQTSYPQTAFALVTLDRKLSIGATQLIEVYTRAGAAAPWLRAATVATRAKVSWPKNGSVVQVAPAKVNGLEIRQMPQLIAALNGSKNAPNNAFTDNTELTWAQNYVKKTLKTKGIASASATYSTSFDSWSFVAPTADFVVVSTRLNVITTLKPGYTYTYNKEYRQAYPGKYTGTSDTSSVVMLVQVPSKGRSTVLDDYRFLINAGPY